MTTIEQQQTVEDILRPLAEATVWPSCTCLFERGDREGLCILHGGSPRAVPDPRFDALRSEIEDFDSGGERQPWLGAIVRAALACGFAVFVVALGEVRLVRQDESRLPWQQAWYGYGDTVEDAAARALAAAMGAAKKES